MVVMSWLRRKPGVFVLIVALAQWTPIHSVTTQRCTDGPVGKVHLLLVESQTVPMSYEKLIKDVFIDGIGKNMEGLVDPRVVSNKPLLRFQFAPWAGLRVIHLPLDKRSIGHCTRMRKLKERAESIGRNQTGPVIIFFLGSFLGPSFKNLWSSLGCIKRVGFEFVDPVRTNIHLHGIDQDRDRRLKMNRVLGPHFVDWLPDLQAEPGNGSDPPLKAAAREILEIGINRHLFPSSNCVKGLLYLAHNCNGPVRTDCITAIREDVARTEGFHPFKGLLTLIETTTLPWTTSTNGSTIEVIKGEAFRVSHWLLGLIAGIGAALIIVEIIVCAFLMRSRRRKRESQAQAEENTIGDEGTNESEKTSPDDQKIRVWDKLPAKDHVDSAEQKKQTDMTPQKKSDATEEKKMVPKPDKPKGGQKRPAQKKIQHKNQEDQGESESQQFDNSPEPNKKKSPGGEESNSEEEEAEESEKQNTPYPYKELKRRSSDRRKGQKQNQNAQEQDESVTMEAVSSEQKKLKRKSSDKMKGQKGGRRNKGKMGGQPEESDSEAQDTDRQEELRRESPDQNKASEYLLAMESLKPMREITQDKRKSDPTSKQRVKAGQAPKPRADVPRLRPGNSRDRKSRSPSRSPRRSRTATG